MKKIISLLMALIFVFSMAAPSFAAVAANEAVALQASDVNGGDEASDANDFLGNVVNVLNQIWTRIVDFFKNLFGFGFKPGTYNVIYYSDEAKTERIYTVPTEEGSEIKEVAVPTKIGYTFKGWEPALPSVMPDEDVEVYATWSIKTVTIKFDTGKAERKVPDIKTTYGSFETLPNVDDVEKEVLIGWKDTLADKIYNVGASYEALDNVTLVAVWGVKATTITFDPNGGYFNNDPKQSTPFPITQVAGEKVTAPNDPTRPGYKFDGWDGVVPTSQPAEDRTYTAVWTPLSITTTWKAKDGTVLNTQTTKCGEKLSPKVSPVPEAGWKFAGWKSDVDGVVYNSFPIATPSVNTTFTAYFEAIEYEYVFKGENGAVLLSGKALCGADVAVPDAPEKLGHTFDVWKDATGADLEVNYDEDGKAYCTMQAGDAAYTATYIPNPHTITWNAAGGKVNGKDSDVTPVAYGSEINAPTDVTRAGYVFVDWTPSVPATMPDENLTFTATWTEAGDTPYTVETYTMDTKGEYTKTTAENKGVTNAEVTLTPEGKEGFTLNSGKSVLAGTIAANGSTVLKVYYDRNKYNVIIDGETNQYYFGEIIKAPAAAEKEGNIFKGWRGSDGKLYAAGADVTVPAIDNFEFVAEYEVINYKITFYTYSANSTEYTVWHSADVAYEGDIVAPAAPSIPNMYFEGWSQNKESTTAEALLAKMPAHNLTYYAVFSENVTSYTVTFDANGGTFESGATTTARIVFRGQPINLPEKDPMLVNTRFLGWAYDKDAKEAEEIGNLTEAKDITIYAVYAPITCEVKFNYKDIDGTVKSYIFDAETDAESDTVIYTIETDNGTIEIDPPVLEGKKGYTVSNWGLDKVNGEEAERDKDGNLKTEDIFTISKADYTREYYCEYVINKNTVVYVGDENCNWGTETTEDGGEITHTEKTEEVAFGEDIIAPAGPNVVAEGLAFIGWTADDGKTILPAGAKLGTVGKEDDYTDATVYTFTAVYDVNKFIIDYDYEGEIVNSEELAFGDTVKGYEVTEEQVDPGLDFVEWKELPEKIDIAAYQTSTFDAERGAYVIKTVALNNKKDFSIKFTNCFKDPIVVKYLDSIDAAAANAAPESEIGYTFAGWLDSDGNAYTFPETMPAEDIVVEAKWDINSHTVTWIVGETSEEVTYEYGADIEVPAAPEVEGYTFTGWDKSIPSTMPDEALTFTAVFTINQYDVTWIVDGVETTETYDYNAKIYAPADPSKTGYTFIGWGEDYSDGMVMPSSDLTFTAEWEINKHTVSWIVDGVTKYRDTYNYGDAIKTPADPEKNGYEFTGWTPTVATTMGDADLTYTATWKECEYEVIFLSGEDHGNVPEAVMVPYGKKIADYAPAAFDGATNTEGQYIAGWEGLSADDKMPVPEEGQEFKYTAIWEYETYKFNFVYGENKVTVVSAAYNGELDTAAPTTDGYNFLGWYDAEGNEITLPMTVEKDYGENGATVEFTADWEALPFDAVFKANGGNWGEVANEDGTTSLKTTETIKYLCDEEIILPEAPVREGYTFKGWVNYTDGDKMPAGGVEFLADWEVKTFTVTFKYGGGKDAEGKTSKVVTLPYGAKIEVPADVSYEGYTWSKWSPVVKDTLDVESNLEYTAIWIANTDTKYTVEVYKMDTEGDYGEPEVITKSGTTNELGKAVEGEEGDYVVEAGQEIDAVKSTGSLSAPITADGKAVIKVYIARKQFDVYTEVDGVKEKHGAFYYGATVAEPALKEKEGYTFTWEGIPEDGFMPAEDVVIKGIWTVKTYTVTVGNAGKDKVYEFAYGEEIVIPEPTRDGYTFAGWDKELPATMPANNITVNANWEKNS